MGPLQEKVQPRTIKFVFFSDMSLYTKQIYFVSISYQSDKMIGM